MFDVNNPSANASVQRIKYLTLMLSYIAWLCFFTGPVYATNVLPIVTDEDNIQEYRQFVDNRPIMTIDYYGGVGARRDVVEMVLFQQALILGGMTEHSVVFSNETSYRRLLRRAAEGRVVAIANGAWLEDINDFNGDLVASDALVRNGEFIVGLYTAPDNPALKMTHLEQLLQLNAVTHSQWRSDWRTLEHLGFNKLHDAPHWPSIARMILAGRADVTLAPFRNTDTMSIDTLGLSLVPVPNIRVSLEGSRHWAISRTHPLSQPVEKAVNKGLQQLKATGRLEQAYTDCGFFHNATQSWPIINAEQLAQP